MKFNEEQFRHLACETRKTVIALGATSECALKRHEKITEMLAVHLKKLDIPFERGLCLQWVDGMEHAPASALSASHVEWIACRRFVILLAEQEAGTLTSWRHNPSQKIEMPKSEDFLRIIPPYRVFLTESGFWEQTVNSNNNFSAIIPYDMEQQRKESREFLDDITSRDQRMMFAAVTIVHTAATKEQLDADTDSLLSTARRNLCQLAPLTFQQLDGLNTVLPFGHTKIQAVRTLTTESLAVLMPFKVQEVMDRGGIYYGQNAISHNLIMYLKEYLLNPNAFRLGVPGSGKSFGAKMELVMIALMFPDDDILVCDPEAEL
jgi:hypothetical protein